MIGSPDTGVTYKTGRMQDSATCIQKRKGWAANKNYDTKRQLTVTEI